LAALSVGKTLEGDPGLISWEKAHERKGFLGRPAGGEKETLRRRKPKRVVDFRLNNSRGSHRRSQG
jgi:hypothetical protein